MNHPSVSPVQMKHQVSHDLESGEHDSNQHVSFQSDLHWICEVVDQVASLIVVAVLSCSQGALNMFQSLPVPVWGEVMSVATDRKSVV